MTWPLDTASPDLTSTLKTLPANGAGKLAWPAATGAFADGAWLTG